MTRLSDDQLAALVAALPKYQRCIVSAHVNGDGDCFGSQLALAHLLRQLGKDVRVIDDSDIPESFKFMPGIDRIERPQQTLPPYDALFVVDVPVLERLGQVAVLHDKTKPIVVIDHHVPAKPFGAISYIDPTAASAGELVYRLYDALHVPIDREAAIAIYVTLLTDTGSFRYSNTTADVHRIAARLIEAGADPASIFQEIYEHHTLADLRIQRLGLEQLHTGENGKLAWIALSQARLREAHASLESSDALIDLPRSLWGTEAVFVTRELEPNVWRVSLRSKGRMDVNAIAKQFGGGGHRAASGCTIPGDEASVVTRLTDALRQRLAIECP